LGKKNVFIDAMVVQDPLDFSLLLGRDYVYAMKAIVSTLFHVISFPHGGIIVTIDQLSFNSPDWMTSLNGSYMQTVSPLPHVVPESVLRLKVQCQGIRKYGNG
jgi:hypothetical protein